MAPADSLFRLGFTRTSTAQKQLSNQFGLLFRALRSGREFLRSQVVFVATGPLG
jgi:hypothetical protein